MLTSFKKYKAKLSIISFLDAEMVQVAEIFSRERQASAYCTLSVQNLLMARRYKEPGHQLYIC